MTPRFRQRLLFFLLLFFVFWLAVGTCYLLYRFQILSIKPRRADCCEVVPASLTQVSRKQVAQETKASSNTEAFFATEAASAAKSSAATESSSAILALLDPSQGARRVVLEIQPQIQRVWNYCAPTTVSMILQSQGIEVSQEVLAQEMGTAEPFGTHNANAIDVLNRHLKSKAEPGKIIRYTLATVTSGARNSEDMRLFLDRLLENIDHGYPMYYTFDVSKIYPGRKGEHNVIGIGYALDEAGDVEKLYYWDPDPTVQDPIYKGLKVVSPTKLLDAMTTCVEPNYGW